MTGSTRITQEHSQEPLLSAQDQILNDTFGNDDNNDDDDDHPPIDNNRRLNNSNNHNNNSSITLSLDQENASSAALCQPDSGSNSRSLRFAGLRGLFVGLASRSMRAAATAATNTSDGVFTNIQVKNNNNQQHQQDADTEEPLPSYEEAAADSTPPYWETVIMAPGMGNEQVFVDGLPVGNFFNFIWNMLISVCFQYVGFLMTYLLHSTHAAKNGSKAGLGITLIQYSFKMRGGSGPDEDSSVPSQVIGSDPNGYEFGSNPTAFIQDDDGSSNGGGFSSQDWLSYAVMAVGWFILIGAITGYIRARNMETLALETPSSTTTSSSSSSSSNSETSNNEIV